ncbi:similar to An01g11250 [Aspergillus luchuensis]|uniref:Similar to An01g11250 n=1 Tax=Aspergillus kawachii TaxID=1069201 RepID=A0A146F0N7_ASPKA|nr:similar to An01g11250 [Aspergillus luchuensis]
MSIPDHGRERGIEVVRDKSDTRDPVFVIEISVHITLPTEKYHRRIAITA